MWGKIFVVVRFLWPTLTHEISLRENLTHELLWPQKFLRLRYMEVGLETLQKWTETGEKVFA